MGAVVGSGAPGQVSTGDVWSCFSQRTVFLWSVAQSECRNDALGKKLPGKHHERVLDFQRRAMVNKNRGGSVNSLQLCPRR